MTLSASKLTIGTAAAVVALLVAACGSSETPVASAPSVKPGLTVQVDIPEGASGTSIGALLESAGVADAEEFTNLAATDPAALGIQPGTYSMLTGTGARQALSELVDGKSKVSHKVVVKPGDRASEIASAMVEAGLDERAALQALRVSGGGVSSLDGLLGPATYDVLPGDTPQDMVVRMVREGKEAVEVAEELSGPEADTRQLLTIASILHAEVLPRDWSKASRAIRNRLASRMPLQLDSTAAYAAGVRQLELASTQLDVDSPYNTYLQTGLPPGPIGQVSTDAVVAAARPEPGPWLYWVTVDPDTGETRFTSTYSEFLQAKAEYKKWLASR